jgi:hypothetical protein
MKVIILHNEVGRIISVSHPFLKPAGSRCERASIVPGKGQLLLDVELVGEQSKMTLLDLHKLHRVDRATSRLVKI